MSFQQVKERQCSRKLWWHNIRPKLLDCQRGIATKQFRVVSQEMQDAILKGRVDSRARSHVIDVQTQMQSFNFFYGIKLGVLVFRHTDNSSSTLRYTHNVHVIKLSKLQKHVFYHYKTWERKLVSVWFLKKLERQNKKLEIDDPRPPKKNSFESLWGRRSSCKMCIQKKNFGKFYWWKTSWNK